MKTRLSKASYHLLKHVSESIVEHGKVPVVVLHGLLHKAHMAGVHEALNSGMANGGMLGLALCVHLWPLQIGRCISNEAYHTESSVLTTS